MNKPPVNNQLLIDYLLNSLPAEQTEEIDELSFTDDQFAGELAAAERDLVDAYIQGELPDSALKKFETHYLASPHRREKVVFARALQEAAKVETTAFIQKNSGASQSKQRLSEFFINIFGGFKPVQWGYAAATLLILIIGGWFVIQSWQRATQSDDTQARRTASETPPTNNEVRTAPPNNSENEIARKQANSNDSEKQPKQIPQSQPERSRLAQQKSKNAAVKNPAAPKTAGLASLILTAPLRGSNQLQTVFLTNNTLLVSVQLELEADDYKVYQVALQNQTDGATLWRSGKLKSKKRKGKKVLQLKLPADLVNSEFYTLEVKGTSSNGEQEIVGSYSFRVARQAKK
jgi:hypothetical protein